MAGKPLVLVVARQRAVRLLVGKALRPAGLRVVAVSRAVPSEDELTDFLPDVIVLEAEEPPERTAEQIRRVKASGTAPVLLMSPRATPTRVATMLDRGADDYIARPFDSAELAARVKSLVRRHGDRLHAGRRRVGKVTVDLDARTMVGDDGRSLSLTRPEWALIARLVDSEGRILMREELLAAAFGDAARDDAALLRITIGRLRRKLGLAPWDEGAIRTIHGVGYAFDPEGRLPLSWSGRRAASSGHEERARLPASASVAAGD